MSCHHFLLIQTKEFTREYAIQTEQELASNVESRRAWGGEDGVRGGTCMWEGHTRVCAKEPYVGRDINVNSWVLWLWRMVGQEAILYRDGHF